MNSQNPASPNATTPEPMASESVPLKSSACCSPAEQEACCEPEAKSSCCGAAETAQTPQGETCGCR